MKDQGFAVAPGVHILVGVKRSEVFRQFHNDTNVNNIICNAKKVKNAQYFLMSSIRE